MSMEKTSGRAYQALYRKYRPSTFEDVRGRDAIVRTLKNQIVSGTAGHSYLFCGTRGTGKTTVAKIFAKAVNCENPADGSPCCRCRSCLSIEKGANLNVVEMDAASNNGVDDIRGIIDAVAYSPSEGKYRVYIIDEVHMLSAAAFNALLKTLEEPPEYVIFILATTEPNRLPVTILSRCQRYDFGRLSSKVIAGRLREVCEAEEIRIEDRALVFLSEAADGSMRDGLSLLDQCRAFSAGEDVLTYPRVLEILGAADVSVYHGLFVSLHEGRAKDALTQLDTLLSKGMEITQFASGFAGYLRNLMLVKAAGSADGILDVSDETAALLKEDAGRAQFPEIFRAVKTVSAMIEQVRYAADRRIIAEMALIRLCTPAMDEKNSAGDEALDVLYERIRQLENRISELETGMPAVPPAGAGARGAVRPGNSSENGEEPAREQKVRPVPAIPDDIRQIVKAWPKLISAFPFPAVRQCLLGASLSLGEEGELLIVAEDGVPADYLKRDDSREALDRFLLEKTGKQVRTQYRFLDKGENFRDNYVDLQGIVNMPVEIEDENEEDNSVWS